MPTRVSGMFSDETRSKIHVMPLDDPPIWKFIVGVVLFFGIPVSVGVGVGMFLQLSGLSEFWSGMLGTMVAVAGLYFFLASFPRNKRKRPTCDTTEA